MVMCVCLAVMFTACGKGKDQTDSEYVKEKGKLVIGITDYAPMDYEKTKGSGEWIGFDADMAKMAADPATQRWWDVVKPLMQPLEDRAEGEFWSDMEEIYPYCLTGTFL